MKKRGVKFRYYPTREEFEIIYDLVQRRINSKLIRKQILKGKEDTILANMDEERLEAFLVYSMGIVSGYELGVDAANSDVDRLMGRVLDEVLERRNLD